MDRIGLQLRARYPQLHPVRRLDDDRGGRLQRNVCHRRHQAPMIGDVVREAHVEHRCPRRRLPRHLRLPWLARARSQHGAKVVLGRLDEVRAELDIGEPVVRDADPDKRPKFGRRRVEVLLEQQRRALLPHALHNRIGLRIAQIVLAKCASRPRARFKSKKPVFTDRLLR